MKNTKQQFVVELTKFEILAVSGGGECYWIDAEGKVKRGDLGDIGPTLCKDNCCGTLGMGECVSWVYNGTNFEVPITMSPNTGLFEFNAYEVMGGC